MPTQEELDNMSPEEIAELQKQNCPFCKIISGEIPAQKVYEDEKILAILDINPSRKGHVLVMPKDHQPILPLLPAETFSQLFKTTKLISEGVKKAMLTPSITIFIANGAVAGQQSPHFLFHIIPREEGDGLEKLELEGDASLLPKQKEIHGALKQNMTKMLQSHLQRQGKTQGSGTGGQGQSQGEQTSGQQQQLTKEQLEEKRQKISKIIEENAEVRQMLAENPEEFKKKIRTSDELKEVFYGVDIDALSKNIKQLMEQNQSSETQTQQNNQTQQKATQQTTDHSKADRRTADHRPQNTEHRKQNTVHRPKHW